MSFNSTLQGNERLKNLRKWLNFELPGAVLFAISFFYNVAFTVFIVVAIIFTPYMIFVLIQERRYGWILFFVLFVLLPGAVSYYFLMEGATVGGGFIRGGMLAGAIPMALYLFYCYFLKLSIPGMLDE